ncbi:DUF2808 domain-containing protein [Leptolyngbya sp. AN03gr2]|uniref:DUF2808 domain-containing protein n=1 Tax=unclassified Leptolyngbya TaxID=2650499 RepID=UPI003D3121DE
MLFQKFAIGTIFAIAATIGTQTSAFSQTNFKNPTHPYLSEIGNTQTTISRRSSQNQFKNPTQPKLSEIGNLKSMQPPMAQTLDNPMSQAPMNNGRAYFSHPPRLVRAYTSQPQAYVPSTYEFTLTVPANAGQPLKAVRIAQEQNLRTVKFDVGRSKAFAGGRFAAGAEIPLASVGGGKSTPGEATIVFDQPVQPGSTVTVALEAKANPDFGGIYEFGVTVFPAGEDSLGQFLGFGRLSFYSGGAD